MFELRRNDSCFSGLPSPFSWMSSSKLPRLGLDSPISTTSNEDIPLITLRPRDRFSSDFNRTHQDDADSPICWTIHSKSSFDCECASLDTSFSEIDSHDHSIRANSSISQSVAKHLGSLSVNEDNIEYIASLLTKSSIQSLSRYSESNSFRFTRVHQYHLVSCLRDTSVIQAIINEYIYHIVQHTGLNIYENENHRGDKVQHDLQYSDINSVLSVCYWGYNRIGISISTKPRNGEWLCTGFELPQKYKFDLQGGCEDTFGRGVEGEEWAEGDEFAGGGLAGL